MFQDCHTEWYQGIPRGFQGMIKRSKVVGWLAGLAGRAGSTRAVRTKVISTRQQKISLISFHQRLVSHLPSPPYSVPPFARIFRRRNVDLAGSLSAILTLPLLRHRIISTNAYRKDCAKVCGRPCAVRESPGWRLCHDTTGTCVSSSALTLGCL